MAERKGSDVTKRGTWSCVAVVVGALSGCGTSAPELDEILERNKLNYKDMGFTEMKLAQRMEEIDANYAEPRTPTKVQLSYETSLDSISQVNRYDALWRGTRACAWLALNHPERAGRVEFAEKGIRMGYEAAKKTSTRVESHYFLALCMGGLADVKGTATSGLVKQLRDRMLLAKAIDPAYDHCGPDRFLGVLTVETAGYPLYNVGTTEDGLKLLRKASEKCPDFGENHLRYAKALIKDDQNDLARVELEKVLRCPKPKDYTAEHEAWLQEATQLLTETQPE